MVQYFRTYLRFSRNGKLILSYTLVKGLTLAIQGLVYNLYLLSLHFDWGLIGVLDAMPPVTVLVVSVPLGMLADRIGRKMLLVICTLVNPFSVLGMALSTSPTWQVVFGLANGVMSSFYWIAYPAIIVESSTEEDRQHLFSVNSMLMLGMGSLGYLLGGAITVVAGGGFHQSPPATGAPGRGGPGRCSPSISSTSSTASGSRPAPSAYSWPLPAWLGRSARCSRPRSHAAWGR